MSDHRWQQINEEEEQMSDDPMDYYDEYMAYLMNECPELIHNGDDLVKHFEAGTRFDEFLEWRQYGTK
jgi:hypothetical protein